MNIANLRRMIFGASNLSTQDIVDHFNGRADLAEAYLNGSLDWRGQPVSIAAHFRSEALVQQYLQGFIDWNGRPVKF